MSNAKTAAPMLPEVSRETAVKFEQYLALLAKWQKAVNLVAPGTLAEAANRHIADSAQLAPLIPDSAKILFDFGSGAGFPGLVLAMLRPDLQVHLVESDSKKCSFLATVSRETDTPVIIHSSRIEQLITAEHLPAPDVITARALTSLAALLDFCLPWAARNPGLLMLFPKGAKAEIEMAAAAARYDFSLEQIPSLTDPAATILVVRDLRPKKPDSASST